MRVVIALHATQDTIQYLRRLFELQRKKEMISLKELISPQTHHLMMMMAIWDICFLEKGTEGSLKKTQKNKGKQKIRLHFLSFVVNGEPSHSHGQTWLVSQ